MGTYEAITETEYSLELKLKVDGTYTFYHKNKLITDRLMLKC